MVTRAKVTRDGELKGGSPLRRYMDLSKFVDLLRSKSIYLRRADCFPDPFEGALTPLIREAMNAARPGGADAFFQRSRKGTYVSCWTTGSKDNMALWQLFGSTDKGIAISTNVDRVARMCQGWDEHAHITKVKYIDHFESPDMIIGRSYDPLQFKHEAFEFEREVRVMLPALEDLEGNPEGVRRPIADINELITSVIVAPEAGEWFLEAVHDLARRYGLKTPVKLSPLAVLPS